MTYYIACPPGQDPQQFTKYVRSLAPGDFVQRDTSTRAYVLKVGPDTHAKWVAARPSPAGEPAPASATGPGDVELGDESSEQDAPAESAPVKKIAKRTRKGA